MEVKAVIREVSAVSTNTEPTKYDFSIFGNGTHDEVDKFVNKALSTPRKLRKKKFHPTTTEGKVELEDCYNIPKKLIDDIVKYFNQNEGRTEAQTNQHEMFLSKFELLTEENLKPSDNNRSVTLLCPKCKSTVFKDGKATWAISDL